MSVTATVTAFMIAQGVTVATGAMVTLEHVNHHLGHLTLEVCSTARHMKSFNTVELNMALILQRHPLTSSIGTPHNAYTVATYVVSMQKLSLKCPERLSIKRYASREMHLQALQAVESSASCMLFSHLPAEERDIQITTAQLMYNRWGTHSQHALITDNASARCAVRAENLRGLSGHKP
eukprot:3336522-Amphidinium_carterae.1